MRLHTVFVVVTAITLASLAGADQAIEVFDPNEIYVSQPPSTDPAARPALTDASETVLWDNGPLVNCPGCGAGGADESQVQTAALSMGTYGFGHYPSQGTRVADDFDVTDPAGAIIDTITFFAYQTGSTTASTMTAVNLQIWDGPPDNPASTVVWGDTTTNVLISTGWTNIYRVYDTTTGATNRPIMANVAAVGAQLFPGTYWLDWQTDGSLTSGPWAPPITINGQATTGNALQWTPSAWVPADDPSSGTQQGFPFIIEGQAAEPPGPFYVIDEFANETYRVDPFTATSVFVGPTVEDPSFSGMAFDTSTGAIYVSDITMPGLVWGLGVMDRFSGEISIVGSHIHSANIWALAYDSINDVLFGADDQCPGGSGLSVVDRHTGESICIASFGTASNVMGLAYDSATDTLYAIDYTSLNVVDRGTGAATPVGAHGIAGITNRSGLEYISDLDRLYATTNTGDLYEIDRISGAATLVGATGFSEASASAHIPRDYRGPAFTPFPGLLWDNGDTDGSNAYSNAIPPAIADRRTLLDDFVVPAGEETWHLRHFRWRHMWNSLTSASGTGVELTIRTNDPNGGGPGVDGPGPILATPIMTFYSELPTGRSFYGRPEMISMAEFVPIAFPAGRYWLEWSIIGPENDFSLISTVGVRDNECWVNYDDLGGLQSSSSQFGTVTDLAWAIGDYHMGLFEDGFESGDTSAWP